MYTLTDPGNIGPEKLKEILHFSISIIFYHFTRQNINLQATTIGMQGLKDKFGCTDMPGTGIFGSNLY